MLLGDILALSTNWDRKGAIPGIIGSNPKSSYWLFCFAHCNAAPVSPQANRHQPQIAQEGEVEKIEQKGKKHNFLLVKVHRHQPEIALLAFPSLIQPLMIRKHVFLDAFLVMMSLSFANRTKSGPIICNTSGDLLQFRSMNP